MPHTPLSGLRVVCSRNESFTSTISLRPSFKRKFRLRILISRTVTRGLKFPPTCRQTSPGFQKFSSPSSRAPPARWITYDCACNNGRELGGRRDSFEDNILLTFIAHSLHATGQMLDTHYLEIYKIEITLNGNGHI